MVYSGVAVTAGTEQPAATAATNKKPGLTHKIPDTPGSSVAHLMVPEHTFIKIYASRYHGILTRLFVTGSPKARALATTSAAERPLPDRRHEYCRPTNGVLDSLSPSASRFSRRRCTSRPFGRPPI